jgi:hypothetical protein
MNFHPQGSPNNVNIFVKVFGVGGVESLDNRGLEIGSEHIHWEWE